MDHLIKNITASGILVTLFMSISYGQFPHAPEFNDPTPLLTNTLSPVRQISRENQTRSDEISNPLILDGTPEEMAVQFLTANIENLQLDPELRDISVSKIRESPGGKHVQFIQDYNGIEVENSNIVVSINNQDKISFYMSDYFPNVSVPSINPALSIETAIEIAINELSAKDLIGDPRGKLVIVPLADGFKLAYKVIVICESPIGDWQVYIDAQNGNVIWIHDVSRYYDAYGKVFRPNPLSSAHHWYGTDGFVDNDNADSQNLTDQEVVVTLRDVHFMGYYYRLHGPYVDIVDFESPHIDPEWSTGHFYYTRSQTGFEEVMAYYYIDTNQRYLQSLGYTNIQNDGLEVDAHGFSNHDNSHYLPDINKIGFGDGEVDGAEDAQIILHEYAHAITGDQISGNFSYALSAMDEGFGDYWALSYSATLSSFDPTDVFLWDCGYTAQGACTFKVPRSVASGKHYPTNLDNSDIHADGEIWSAALWDIRNELGREIADKLVIQSHYYLSSSANWIEAANAIIVADLDLFQGAHVFALCSILTNRGFDHVGIHGELPGDQTWAGHDLLMNGDVTIAGGSTLTISPGSEIIISHDFDFTGSGYHSDKAEFLVDGVLNLNGENGNEIIIRSDIGNGALGDWGGITTTSTGSINCNFVNIENATFALWGENAGNVQITNSKIGYSEVTGITDHHCLSLSIENSEVHDCAFGIQLDLSEGASVSITGSDIHDNDYDGVTPTNNQYGVPANQYGTVNISKNIIHDNGGYGIKTSQAQTLIENNTILDNGNGAWVNHVNNAYDYTQITNNLIVENNLNGSGNGLTLGTTDYLSYEIEYNNVWGNNGQNYINIPDRTGYFGNISEDPLLNAVFELTWANEPSNDATKSPCIDAGDPAQIDPDNSTRDIGAKYYDKTPEIPTLNITTQDWEHPYLTWNSSDIDIDHYTIYKRYYINKFNQTTSYVNDYTATSYTDVGFVGLAGGGATAYYKVSPLCLNSLGHKRS